MAGGTMWSRSPWTTSTGQRTLRQSSAAPSSSAYGTGASVCMIVSGVVSSPKSTPSSICLSECGSLKTWPKKNSRKPRQSASQEWRFMRSQPSYEGSGSSNGARSRLGGAGDQADRRTDREEAEDALGVAPGQLDAVAGAGRQPDRHDALDAGRVEHRQRVVDDLVVVVGRVALRPVGSAVAARIERHHAVAPRQIRDLGLPDAAVADRPRGQEQDRRVARRRMPPTRPSRRRARCGRSGPGGGLGFRYRSGPRGRRGSRTRFEHQVERASRPRGGSA